MDHTFIMCHSTVTHFELGTPWCCLRSAYWESAPIPGLFQGNCEVSQSLEAPPSFPDAGNSYSGSIPNGWFFVRAWGWAGRQIPSREPLNSHQLHSLNLPPFWPALDFHATSFLPFLLPITLFSHPHEDDGRPFLYRDTWKDRHAINQLCTSLGS